MVNSSKFYDEQRFFFTSPNMFTKKTNQKNQSKFLKFKKR